jgi:hypothetical protein
VIVVRIIARSLAEGFAGRYAAPRKPAGRRTVTVESDIIEFLGRRRGRLFCDDCLTRELRYAQRTRIDAATKVIGATVGFRRATEMCAGCGGVRDGTKAG